MSEEINPIIEEEKKKKNGSPKRSKVNRFNAKHELTKYRFGSITLWEPIKFGGKNSAYFSDPDFVIIREGDLIYLSVGGSARRNIFSEVPEIILHVTFMKYATRLTRRVED